jgi:hypothetical protein
MVMEIPVAREYQDILRSDGPDGDSRKRGQDGETSAKHPLMGIDDNVVRGQEQQILHAVRTKRGVAICLNAPASHYSTSSIIHDIHHIHRILGIKSHTDIVYAYPVRSTPFHPS